MNNAEQDPVADLLGEFLDRRQAGENPRLEEYLARCPEARRDEFRQALGFVEKIGVQQVGSYSFEPEKTFGDFEIVREIGRGGMGVVYEAHQRSIDRPVALKLIAPWVLADDLAIGRLNREANALARLRHEHIVTVHATGEHDGVRFLAMELLPGQGLDELIAAARTSKQAIPLPKLLRWVAEIARALESAHGAGIIHRDIKPSNIRITPESRAVLLDFGLAHNAASASVARTGLFRGSPHYASPEQVEGKRDGIGPQTDVFSLGVTLFEAATGVLPFTGDTNEQIFHQILSKEPSRPRKLQAEIPRDLETVILKALEKDVSRRYASAADFAADLEALLEIRPIQARPASSITRMTKWAQRNRGYATALAVGLTGLLVAGFLWLQKSGLEEKLELYPAAIRVLKALQSGEEPARQDLEIIATGIPDAAAREALFQRAREEAVWEALYDQMPDPPRSGVAYFEALKYPRAAVATRRPEFRFELPQVEGSFVLILMGSDREWKFLIPTEPGKTEYRWELPEDVVLEEGTEYRWRMQREEPFDGDFLPAAGIFRVLPSATVEAVKKLGGTGNENLDRLLRSAAYLEQGLALEGIAELRDFPKDAPEAERIQREFLLARAASLLNRHGAFETLRKRVLRDD